MGLYAYYIDMVLSKSSIVALKFLNLHISQASRVDPTISVHMLAINWILAEPYFMKESNFFHRNSVSKLMDFPSLLTLVAATMLLKCWPK